MSEAKIMREVQLRLGSRPDCRLWRQNVGSGWVPTGAGYRPQAFGVKGQPDLMGCLTVRGIGVWLGVEVKDGRGRQTQDQADWQAIMEASGGVYLLARSADDAERQLERAIEDLHRRMAA